MELASRSSLPAASPRKHSWFGQTAFFLISFSGFLLTWELIARLLALPAFILPTPGLVFQRTAQVLMDGSLLYHSSVTLSEVLAGLLLGAVFASLLGYWLAKSPLAERWLTPYIVASQSIPVAAIAPLLVIWFGPGWFSKVLTCALIVFFPVLINLISGMHAAPPTLIETFRSVRASRRDLLWHVHVPASLPFAFAALKTAAPLALVGAVVAEWTGASGGLGRLLWLAYTNLNLPLLFAAALLLGLGGVLLYTSVVWLERRIITW